jgi:hypothetical protein
VIKFDDSIDDNDKQLIKRTEKELEFVEESLILTDVSMHLRIGCGLSSLDKQDVPFCCVGGRVFDFGTPILIYSTSKFIRLMEKSSFN